MQDVLALRVAADCRRSDGCIVNDTLGTERFDARRRTLRGPLFFEPTPEFSAALKPTHAENSGGETLADAASFPDRRVGFDVLPGMGGPEFDIADLRLRCDLTDSLGQESESACLDAECRRQEEFDGTGGPSARSSAFPPSKAASRR